MVRRKRASADRPLQEVVALLETYKAQHPKADVHAYRYNSASIRIRIIDPDFRNLSRIERDDMIWKLLDTLPEEVVSHVSLVLLLTPAEKSKSYASSDFDNPIPVEM